MNNNIIIFKTEDEQVKVDVRFYDESVWLTIDQMADLFERDKSTISRHIRNVYADKELLPESTVAKFATVQIEGGREVCPIHKRLIKQLRNTKNIKQKP